VLICLLGQARNTPPRIRLNFVPPPDCDALNPIMNDTLAMHDPYPAYNPPSATPEGLAPLVDIASYPICAGQFTMHSDYSVTLQNGEGGDKQQDNSVPLHLALENLRDADQEEANRQIAKNIGFAVISNIQDCNDFTYSGHRVNRTAEGYSLYFVCSSDLATQPSETNRWNKMCAGAIPTHGKFRLRVDCGGTVSIVVTTEAVTVDYKHRPLHEKAPNRRVDNQLKDIIRDNNFPPA
jgi:Tfp pilus assembly protein PilV